MLCQVVFAFESVNGILSWAFQNGSNLSSTETIHFLKETKLYLLNFLFLLHGIFTRLICTQFKTHEKLALPSGLANDTEMIKVTHCI